ncbi:MAG: replication-associated recombination protein A [Microthrixaceae bacterium]
MEDLFTAAARERLEARGPLADRMRPVDLDGVVGQEHLLGAGAPLRALVEADRLSSVILWGPPGTGKTTLARLLAHGTAKDFVALSAVTASVKDIRSVTAAAQDALGEHGRGTILFLDEIHRFNKAQQDALLPAVETGLIVLIGATTENPHFEVNPPLMSRSTLFRLRPLDESALHELLRRGLDAEEAEADPEAAGHLVATAAGDGRHLLTSLEVAVALARSARERGRGDDGVVVRLQDAEAAIGVASVRYGRDEHYDVVSAFIKSIRGSDPDAALHWLARMLEAGEDARFVARRLVIAASEDIGLADPGALLVADAAARAVEFVGLPEARINLAQATVHLALAPKSNTAYEALGRAVADLRDRPVGEVPEHLRDSHYRGAQSLGHGVGYEYPHDRPSGWVQQQYMPDELAGTSYYRPGAHGREQALVEAWRARTGQRGRAGEPDATGADPGREQVGEEHG